MISVWTRAASRLLYRIATNARLNALERRATAGRVVPEAVGPPGEPIPSGAPQTEVAWLGPYPDAALGRFPRGRPGVQSAPDERQRAPLGRYVRAWGDADLDGFVGLLTEDAILSMPPWPQWCAGREACAAFFTWATTRADLGPEPYRFVPTAAKGQPSFGLYAGDPAGDRWHAHAIQVLTVEGGAIAGVINFREPELFAAFSLPAVLPAGGARPPE
jgi:hypothetical protein